MVSKYIPTEEQLFKLHTFLSLLRKDKLFWREVKISGDTIAIKMDPPKGEIDIRVFYIYSDGRFDEDGFQEDRLY